MDRRDALAKLAGIAVAVASGVGPAGGESRRNRAPAAKAVLPAWVPEPGTRRNISMTYSRFRWADTIQSFVWADDRRSPVQAWRVRGT